MWNARHERAHVQLDTLQQFAHKISVFNTMLNKSKKCRMLKKGENRQNYIMMVEETKEEEGGGGGGGGDEREEGG